MNIKRIVYAFILGFASLVVISSNTQNSGNAFYTLLTQAQKSGEISITPLIVEKDFPSSIDRAFYADVTQSLNYEVAGNEYIIHDKNSESTLKVNIDKNSNILQDLESFDDVIVEENISFSAQEMSVADLRDQSIRLKHINKFLGSDEYIGQLKSNHNVVVAIVDSGLYHPENFENKIAVNALEKNGKSGLDDDENGYIDDVYGWSALENSDVKTDSNGHGSHLAGIIMALSEVLEKDSIKILPVQVLDSQNNVKLSELLVGLNYAEENGASLINLSIGSTENSEILENKISEMVGKNIIVIAPSGNAGKKQLYNPAAYEDVISVASLNLLGQRAPYSNYGNDVEFSIRGDVISIGSEGYSYKNGTSQSTAEITALVSILMATDEEENDLSSIRKKLKEYSKEVDSKNILGHKIQIKTFLKKIAEK